MAAIHSFPDDDTIQAALRHLRNGECVALPSESTYELVGSAMSDRVVETLARFATSTALPAILVTDDADLAGWVPGLGVEVRRAFRKLGPGPITSQAEMGLVESASSRLPMAAQDLLIRDGRLAIRRPDHAIYPELRAVGEPLIAVPIDGAVDAASAARIVGESAAAIVDGGEAPIGRTPSVVQTNGRRCQLTHVGGLLREELDELSRCRIVFICTGNTCRSPLAKGICERMLADRLGCEPAQLAEHGYSVHSAGLAASSGMPASLEAVVVAQEYRADLSTHQSAMATIELLLWADFIFAMTAGHWHMLQSILADAMTLPRMLSPRHEDIADPIGGSPVDYRTCAQQIAACLAEHLNELIEA
ncbi:MAG: hypothetical protein EXS16_22010 [Gemmataceae bacterium]|nr:hypothetical protein [Gemmataceae bacterium]